MYSLVIFLTSFPGVVTKQSLCYIISDIFVSEAHLYCNLLCYRLRRISQTVMSYCLKIKFSVNVFISSKKNICFNEVTFP